MIPLKMTLRFILNDWYTSLQVDRYHIQRHTNINVTNVDTQSLETHPYTRAHTNTHVQTNARRVKVHGVGAGEGGKNEGVCEEGVDPSRAFELFAGKVLDLNKGYAARAATTTAASTAQTTTNPGVSRGFSVGRVMPKVLMMHV